MKSVFWLLLGVLVSGCGTTRVQVKDCQDIQGMDGQKNCELIRKL